MCCTCVARNSLSLQGKVEPLRSSLRFSPHPFGVIQSEHARAEGAILEEESLRHKSALQVSRRVQRLLPRYFALSGRIPQEEECLLPVCSRKRHLVESSEKINFSKARRKNRDFSVLELGEILFDCDCVPRKTSVYCVN